ncbi:MAG: penicillin-binding protein 2 [Planctomycetes bacterium]|nr:penicillin-binding protein 2 [Planctomycetota bacterium]
MIRPPVVAHRWADLGFLLLLTAFGGLGVRLFFLQHLRSAEGVLAVERQSETEEEVPAPRGAIYTADGVCLAATIRVPSVYCVPSQLADKAAAVRALARILGLNEAELRARLEAPRAFAWVKRKVSAKEAKAVLDLKLAAVGLRSEWKRIYPQHRLAAHLVGFVGPDDRGAEGVEMAQESLLAGAPGRRRYLRDALQHRIAPEDLEEKPAVPGADIHLTINSSIQLAAERALDETCQQWHPASAVAVVIEPATGRILALACRPDFDPNIYQKYAPGDRRNRAITDPFEPGSTFKSFILSAILDRKILGPKDTVFCEHGVYRIGRRTLHDHHPYGTLSLIEIIAKSSNIGMAKLGFMLKRQGMTDTVHRYGFGTSSGIGLPGESGGLVTSYAKWSDYSTTSVSMGHEIAVTPIQLVTAYAAIANRGTLFRPGLIGRIQEADGRVRMEFRPQPVRERVMRPEALDTLVSMLMEVVEEGTGTKARIKGFSSAGKTGTTQKNFNGQYCHDKFYASYVGFAPADAPRALALVVLDEPKGAYYGGTVAAPAVASILEQSLRYLEVKPDRPEELEPGAPKKPVVRGR